MIRIDKETRSSLLKALKRDRVCPEDMPALNNKNRKEMSVIEWCFIQHIKQGQDKPISIGMKVVLLEFLKEGVLDAFEAFGKFREINRLAGADCLMGIPIEAWIERNFE